MIRKTCIFSALLAIALLQPAPANAGYAGAFWNCDSSGLTSFWEEDVTGNELSGRNTLCVTPFGMWSSMQVRGLTQGNAYTVWWIYIDDPASCAGTPISNPAGTPEPENFAGNCGLADFFTLDPSGAFLNPLAVYGRMDSGIASHRRSMRFAGDLRDFKPASGSQVWLLVFGHGPADTSDKRQLARQLLTPEDPLSGVPHLGIEGHPYGYPAGVAVFNIP